MFGMVAATGIRILASVDYAQTRNNLLIAGVGIGVGMLTLAAPHIFHHLPRAIWPLLDSGILLTTVTTIVLNLLFNSVSMQAGRPPMMRGNTSGDERVNER